MNANKRVVLVAVMIILAGLATCLTGKNVKTETITVTWPVSKADSPQPYVVFGEPRYRLHDPSHTIVLTYTGFSVYYDDTVLAPRWAAIKLTSEMIDANSGFKRPGRFAADPALKIKGYQYTVHDDYNNVPGNLTRWDRGHMVQFDDARGYGNKAGAESMYTTNICPQLADLNQKGWLSLEKRMSDFARDYGCVWVLIGPIYKKNPRPFAEGRHVPAPSAFYRIAIRNDGSGGVQAVAFIMPQIKVPANVDLTRYISTIDAIEESTDLDFFHELPDEIEDVIESQKGEIWPYVEQ